jgi:hypothetical protein
VPRTCCVCRHPNRLAIEQAMVARISLRTIAEQFGPSKDSVMRHRSHAIDAITRNSRAQELARTGTLLDDVLAGEDRTEQLYQLAEEILVTALRQNDLRTALQAIRAAVSVAAEMRGYMQLRGELTSELGRDRTSNDAPIRIICPAPIAGQPLGNFVSDLVCAKVALPYR